MKLHCDYSPQVWADAIPPSKCGVCAWGQVKMEVWLLEYSVQSGFRSVNHKSWTITYCPCLTHCKPSSTHFKKFWWTLFCSPIAEKEVEISYRYRCKTWKYWLLIPLSRICFFLCRQAICNSKALADSCLCSCEVDSKVKSEGEQASFSFTDNLYQESCV